MTAPRPELPGRDRAAGMPAPDDRANPEQDDPRIREIVDRWFPLTSEQLERLSLLLNPGARDDTG